MTVGTGTLVVYLGEHRYFHDIYRGEHLDIHLDEHGYLHVLSDKATIALYRPDAWTCVRWGEPDGANNTVNHGDQLEDVPVLAGAATAGSHGG